MKHLDSLSQNVLNLATQKMCLFSDNQLIEYQSGEPTGTFGLQIQNVLNRATRKLHLLIDN